MNRVECLESRTLMAGNVTVALDSSGNMIVTGDSAANGIQLDQYGAFSIQGVDAGGSPTSVNGEPNGVAAFEVTGRGDIRIILKGGADTLEVGVRSDSVSTPDDLRIDTGAGDDRVLTIGDSNVGKDLIINSGAGNDSVFIVSTQVVGNIKVATEADNDIVQIYGSDIGADLEIKSGSGKDAVSIGLFDGPAGRVFGAVKVVGDTSIQLGDGDDLLEIYDSTFGRSFRADSGRGTDSLINIGNTFAKHPKFK